MDDIDLDDSGPSRVSDLVRETPLTNRGSLKPTFKGIDYLRLTIWDRPENLIGTLERAILDRYLPEVCGTFFERGPAGRLLNHWTCSLRGLTVEQGDGWAGVTIKGEPCTILGNQAVLQLLLSFPGVRARATRIDLAWDGFPLSPLAVYRHLKSGNVRTRSVLDPELVRSETGDTCYTHSSPEKRGVERYCRWYNMRGPTRCELVLRRNYAAEFVDSLDGDGVDSLNQKALGALRGFVDLIAPGQERPSRRPLLSSWSRFIRDAEPWTPSQHQHAVELVGLEMLGRYDGQVQRAARSLAELVEAYGAEYVLSRINFHGKESVRLDEVEKLRAIRSAAARKFVAGVTPWPESFQAGDLPI